MERLNFKDESKKSWGIEVKYPDTKLTEEQIKLGAILRIADATELMAINYKDLQSDLERYKRWYHEERERNKALRKSTSSFRGHLTRLKNKLNHIS